MNRILAIILSVLVIFTWELGAGLVKAVLPGDTQEDVSLASLGPSEPEAAPEAVRPEKPSFEPEEPLNEVPDEPQDEVPDSVEDLSHFDQIEIPFIDYTHNSTTNYEPITLNDIVLELMKTPGLDWDPTYELTKKAKKDLGDHFIEVAKSQNNAGYVDEHVIRDNAFYYAREEPNPYDEKKEQFKKYWGTKSIDYDRATDQGDPNNNVWNIRFYEELDNAYQYKYFINHAVGLPGFKRKVMDAVKARAAGYAGLNVLADGKVTVAEYQLMEYIEWKFSETMRVLDNELRSFMATVASVPKPRGGFRIWLDPRVEKYWSDINEIAYEQMQITDVLVEGYEIYKTGKELGDW